MVTTFGSMQHFTMFASYIIYFTLLYEPLVLNNAVISLGYTTWFLLVFLSWLLWLLNDYCFQQFRIHSQNLYSFQLLKIGIHDSEIIIHSWVSFLFSTCSVCLRYTFQDYYLWILILLYFKTKLFLSTISSFSVNQDNITLIKILSPQRNFSDLNFCSS